MYVRPSEGLRIIWSCGSLSGPADSRELPRAAAWRARPTPACRSAVALVSNRASRAGPVRFHSARSGTRFGIRVALGSAGSIETKARGHRPHRPADEPLRDPVGSLNRCAVRRQYLRAFRIHDAVAAASRRTKVSVLMPHHSAPVLAVFSSTRKRYQTQLKRETRGDHPLPSWRVNRLGPVRQHHGADAHSRKQSAMCARAVGDLPGRCHTRTADDRPAVRAQLRSGTASSSRKEGQNWRRLDGGISPETFVLRDGSGDCVVDPGRRGGMPSNKRTWFSEPYRITEWLIRPAMRSMPSGPSSRSIRPTERGRDAEARALLGEWKRNRPPALPDSDTTATARSTCRSGSAPARLRTRSSRESPARKGCRSSHDRKPRTAARTSCPTSLRGSSCDAIGSGPGAALDPLSRGVRAVALAVRIHLCDAAGGSRLESVPASGGAQGTTAHGLDCVFMNKSTVGLLSAVAVRAPPAFADDLIRECAMSSRSARRGARAREAADAPRPSKAGVAAGAAGACRRAEGAQGRTADPPDVAAGERRPLRRRSTRRPPPRPGILAFRDDRYEGTGATTSPAASACSS